MKQEITKTPEDMIYIIDCRHCGSHTEFYSALDRRTQRIADIEERMHIDTESPIRCPACRARLNISEADFRAQIRLVRQI